VSEAASNPSATGRTIGIVGRCAVLWLAVGLFLPLVAWFGFMRHGQPGAIAAAVAALICASGSTAALIATWRFRGPATALHAMLFGMVFQFGLPFVAGMVLSQAGGSLAGVGVFGMIVVFYLYTLVVKTLLVLPLVKPAAPVSKGA
jgi:hypothetical protein